MNNESAEMTCTDTSRKEVYLIWSFSLQRCEETGGGHVPRQTGALRVRQSLSLQQLFWTHTNI